MIERHPHPTVGEVVFHGNPLQFSGAEPRRRALAPRLGEHNAEVFAEIGLGAVDLARLAEAGVI
jgi:formyl-CoA transferase